MDAGQSRQLAGLIAKNHSELLSTWLELVLARLVRRDAATEAEIKRQAAQLLPLLAKALERDAGTNVDSAAWEDVRQTLGDISRAHVKRGMNSIETAHFVLALKSPLFARLRAALKDEPQRLVDETAMTSSLFDDLALHTVAVFQKSREQVILNQQQELLELSTPVVQLWKDVLALPLIGTLDSARTQVVMESLLERIAETGALIAIIDITGVPTVDTLVAQHLLKTVAAARLMGADCIISGIRPQIAQTIVQLGINLADVLTKATLADAFVAALKRTDASFSFTGGND